MLGGQGGERWPELQGEDGVADLQDTALGGQPRSLDDHVDDHVRIAGPHLVVEASNRVKRRVERHPVRHTSRPCRASMQLAVITQLGLELPHMRAGSICGKVRSIKSPQMENVEREPGPEQPANPL